MSRLIDADELLAWINETQWHTSKMNAVRAKINTMPTTDAVSVVRCKDCKKWGYSAGLCRHWSKLYGSVLTRASDFCSYGERKDHE